MSKYNTHLLSLNDEEEAQFRKVKLLTGKGAKKIFMETLNNILNSPDQQEHIQIEEE